MTEEGWLKRGTWEWRLSQRRRGFPAAHINRHQGRKCRRDPSGSRMSGATSAARAAPSTTTSSRFSRSTRPAAGLSSPTRSVATSSLLESHRCPDRPCSSHRRSGGTPEPRQDRLPQCRVNAESSGARNHLDLLPDDVGKADRPWSRAADLEQLLGPPASNLYDETLPRDASGVRVATDPRLGEVDLGNLAQRRCRRLAVATRLRLLHIASVHAVFAKGRRRGSESSFRARRR